MQDTGLRRREDDFKLHPDTGAGLYPGKDRRRHAGPPKPHPTNEFLRRFRRPIIGLSVLGAAAPLLAKQAKAMTGEPTDELEEKVGAAAPGHPIVKPGEDAEEAVARKVGDEVGSSKRASIVGGAIQRYDIDEGLAQDIHDVAMKEGIDPKLAFGLVKTESGFKQRAQSGVGARGLTQVMPKTGAWMLPGTSAEDLYDRKTNLTLGFRYLNKLIDKYRGDVQTALTAYNRGPGTVDKILRRGGDPDNGYAGKVLGGALKQ